MHENTVFLKIISQHSPVLSNNTFKILIIQLIVYELKNYQLCSPPLATVKVRVDSLFLGPFLSSC